MKRRALLLIASVGLAVVSVELSMRAAGLLLRIPQLMWNLRHPAREDSVRILCLGDSTTAHQYPRYLAEYLSSLRPGRHYSVIDRGLGGATTDSVLGELEDDLDADKPAIVVTMLGVNDHGVEFDGSAGARALGILPRLRIIKAARFAFSRLWFEASRAWPGHEQSAYRHRAESLIAMGKFSEARRTMTTAAALRSAGAEAWIMLGDIEVRQAIDERDAAARRSYFVMAENAWHRALSLAPRNAAALYRLGVLDARFLDKPQEAFPLLRRALEINYENGATGTEDPDLPQTVAGIDIDFQRYEQAEEVYRLELAHHPTNERAKRTLTLLKNRALKPRTSLTAERAFVEIQPAEFLEKRETATDRNYLRIADILRQRNTPLVAVQYPVRSADPLRRLLAPRGAVIVDNEEAFRSALKFGSYFDYFVDNFGFDFGHCTEKGNRLLARRIAEAILSGEPNEIPRR